MDINDLLLALRLADIARTVSLPTIKSGFAASRKADGSLVTSVDFAVEDRIRAEIASIHPADAILGEERGPAGASDRRWLIDGIDGTKHLLAGDGDWSTLIALELAGRVVAGVIDQPQLARRFWASEGHGAFTSCGQAPSGRLAVGNQSSLRAARAYIPPDALLPSDWKESGVQRVCRDGNAAAQVAAAALDVCIFAKAAPWDLAAPAIVVIEAGGHFTDLAGKPDIYSGHGLFSNGLLHHAALSELTVNPPCS